MSGGAPSLQAEHRVILRIGSCHRLDCSMLVFLVSLNKVLHRCQAPPSVMVNAVQPELAVRRMSPVFWEQIVARADGARWGRRPALRIVNGSLVRSIFGLAYD